MKRIIGTTGRILLVLATGLALLGSFPAGVAADASPVDLVLGGEGATPWNITGVKPSDSGTRTVELSNAGSQDGFVTIWVSDVVDSEGLNPESETGDTAEPGEFGEYLLLSLNAPGLETNITLPVTIDGLPGSFDAPEYIEVVPVRAGTTVDLQWLWQISSQAGNDLQGDEVSFTVNYLLRECSVIDLTSIVNAQGIFTSAVTATSADGKGRVSITAGTVGKTAANDPLSQLWIIETDRQPPSPPPGSDIVGPGYNLGPSGAYFDRTVTLALSYNQGDIPPGREEGPLVIARWDGVAGEWVTLSGCTVDAAANTVSVPISSFSRYAIIAPPAPPPVYEEEPPAPPDEGDNETDEPEKLGITLPDGEFSIEIGEDGLVEQAFSLADREGNFVLDVAGGTRITGAGGVALGRIELTVTDQPVVLPDGMVIISPVYRLTGYTRDGQATGIEFAPAARLTLRYDPRRLPENSFLPFVASYTDEQGMVRLPVPPGALDELGKAEALVSHTSLFFVVAEVAPPPPPLPAHFRFSNLVISPGEARLGQTVTISLMITNSGETAGSYELHLIIDGIVRAIEDVNLNAGSSQKLTFRVSNLAPGEHQIKVADLTGWLTVTRVEVSLAGPTINWTIIDISVSSVLVLAALVMLVLVLRSRQAQSR